jgi:L-cysteine S-thiosulfotransferase
VKPSTFGVCLAALVLSSCAVPVRAPSDADVVATLRASFAERGSATIDRLDQSDLQKQCSAHAGQELPKAIKEQLEKAAADAVRYPLDGQYLGDPVQGERIAQSGVGLQFTDAVGAQAGGNCYACHQMTKSELAFGNIGPSLVQYGKLRGTSEPVLKYTWARLWNSHAFNACNAMPRFGAAGILSEAQLKHVMALLLDPNSPVNR